MTTDRELRERNAFLVEERDQARRELRAALALADDRERDLAPYEEEIDTLRKELREVRGAAERLTDTLQGTTALAIKAERERDEAREKAREYYEELASGTMSEYLFRKHYGNETTECPWLVRKPPEPPPPAADPWASTPWANTPAHLRPHEEPHWERQLKAGKSIEEV